jgi:hypothetical protein
VKQDEQDGPMLLSLVAGSLEEFPENSEWPLQLIRRRAEKGIVRTEIAERWIELLQKAQSSELGFEGLLTLYGQRSEALEPVFLFHPFAGLLLTTVRMKARELRGERVA